VNGQPHTLAVLPPGNSPRYPLNRRPNGPQSRSALDIEEKESLPKINTVYLLYTFLIGLSKNLGQSCNSGSHAITGQVLSSITGRYIYRTGQVEGGVDSVFLRLDRAPILKDSIPASVLSA